MTALYAEVTLVKEDADEAAEKSEGDEDKDVDTSHAWAQGLSYIFMFLLTIVSGYGFDSNRKLVF